MALSRRSFAMPVLLALSALALTVRAESAQAVVCFTPGWTAGYCSSTTWLGAGGGTEGWKHSSGYHTGSIARMYNGNCSTCPRSMGIWFLAPGASTPIKVETPAPTVNTWTVIHASGAYKRLCINLGGSGGYFACDWDA